MLIIISYKLRQHVIIYLISSWPALNDSRQLSKLFFRSRHVYLLDYNLDPWWIEDVPDIKFGDEVFSDERGLISKKLSILPFYRFFYVAEPRLAHSLRPSRQYLLLRLFKGFVCKESQCNDYHLKQRTGFKLQVCRWSLDWPWQGQERWQSWGVWELRVILSSP